MGQNPSSLTKQLDEPLRRTIMLPSDVVLTEWLHSQKKVNVGLSNYCATHSTVDPLSLWLQQMLKVES